MIIRKVEIYDLNGIHRYILNDNDQLIDDLDNPSSSHAVLEKNGLLTGYNWEKVPVIPFKFNDSEIPLIRRIKALQDGINEILSVFKDNMDEDPRNTILVLKNFDGENLSEFRRNLMTIGAIKVRSDGSGSGGVDTLSVEVNSENYETILKLMKNALIRNARGYDAKDDRMSNNPNQMNIQSMYSDIDLDANEMETEWQAGFEELLFFINAHLANNNLGDFEKEEVSIVFNRDILINETDKITNAKNSVGIISKETIIAQHPWISDVNAEIQQMENEAQAQMDSYMNTFKEGGANGTKQIK